MTGKFQKESTIKGKNFSYPLVHLSQNYTLGCNASLDLCCLKYQYANLAILWDKDLTPEYKSNRSLHWEHLATKRKSQLNWTVFSKETGLYSGASLLHFTPLVVVSQGIDSFLQNTVSLLHCEIWSFVSVRNYIQLLMKPNYRSFCSELQRLFSHRKHVTDYLRHGSITSFLSDPSNHKVRWAQQHPIRCKWYLWHRETQGTQQPPQSLLCVMYDCHTSTSLPALSLQQRVHCDQLWAKLCLRREMAKLGSLVNPYVSIKPKMGNFCSTANSE